MDIKPANAEVSIKALAPYRRQVWILSRTTMPSLPVYPEDIIDTVELDKGRHSPAYTQIVNYKSLSNNPVKEKGTFVDVWI